MRRSMDHYAPARHVGHIYRGHYQKPGLLQPRYRTSGWDSDFRQEDRKAFRNPPKMPNPMCKGILQKSQGFDCRCGMPNRVEKNPYNSPRGSLPTSEQNTRSKSKAYEPEMEKIIGGVV